MLRPYGVWIWMSSLSHWIFLSWHYLWRLKSWPISIITGQQKNTSRQVCRKRGSVRVCWTRCGVFLYTNKSSVKEPKCIVYVTESWPTMHFLSYKTLAKICFSNTALAWNHCQDLWAVHEKQTKQGLLKYSSTQYKVRLYFVLLCHHLVVVTTKKNLPSDKKWKTLDTLTYTFQDTCICILKYIYMYLEILAVACSPASEHSLSLHKWKGQWVSLPFAHLSLWLPGGSQKVREGVSWRDWTNMNKI